MWPFAFLLDDELVNLESCFESASGKGCVCGNLPRRTETNVSDSDSAVDEDDGETRQGKEPVEDVTAVVCQVDECQATEEELDDDHPDGTTLLVDLGHELGCHACS